jgi:hypothetical protein
MTTCWCCAAVLEDQTAVGRGEPDPNPGDVSVCFYCAAVGIYTEDRDIRVPTDAEAARLLNDPEVVRVRAEIVGFRS